MTGPDHAEIVRELRAIGANATRSQMPLPDELLQRLDAAGILVWQVLPPFDSAGAFRSKTPRLRAGARRRALAAAERMAAHPSILAWCLANEVSGRGHPAGQARFVDGVARELHRRDPGRPVGADVWGKRPTRVRGLLFRRLDILGFTDYSGWSDVRGEARVAREARALKRLFPRKSLVVTEFGAPGTRANRSDRVGGEGWQSRLLARRIASFRRMPVDGALVWSLRDYAVNGGFRGGTGLLLHPQTRLNLGLNEKGLFRFDGTAKPAVLAVREAFARCSGVVRWHRRRRAEWRRGPSLSSARPTTPSSSSRRSWRARSRIARPITPRSTGRRSWRARSRACAAAAGTPSPSMPTNPASARLPVRAELPPTAAAAAR